MTELTPPDRVTARPDWPTLGSSAVDPLLRGAVDLHRHGYPELSFEVRTRLEDVDDLALCAAAGFRAVVLKSHMWPTVGRAYLLRDQVPDLEIVPSITLNPGVGGVDPMAVECAAQQGARAVFMPTWGAAHDIERAGMSAFVSARLSSAAAVEREPIRIARDGVLTPPARAVLELAEEHDMLVSTAHISPAESLAIAERGVGNGDRLVFSHPDSHSVGASREEIVEMAERGAMIEICALGTLPRFQRIRPEEMIDVIGAVGPHRCVITSDYFFDWVPPSAEIIRIFVGVLRDLGVSDADLRTMLCENPARLLGLESQP